MISFIGMLAAMVSIALATYSLALAVVVYRRIRGSATSRQETAQSSPAAVAAGGGAVDGTTGRLLITPCWFSRPAAPLDVCAVLLLITSCSCVPGSSRVAVGCMFRWMPHVRQRRGRQGLLLVMPRLVRLLPLVAAWAGWCLALCRVAGRGPPARNARFLSLLAAATTPL